jgi:hypothetical protein
MPPTEPLGPDGTELPAPIPPEEPGKPIDPLPAEGTDEPDEPPGCCSDELPQASKPSIAARLILKITRYLIRVTIIPPQPGTVTSDHYNRVRALLMEF